MPTIIIINALFSVFSAPVVVTVTVAESDENQEEDEEEEETPGDTVHYGRGDGDGDRVHHDSSLAADDLSDLMMVDVVGLGDVL